jgi:hypothetical protein
LLCFIVGNPEWNRPVASPTHRQEDNIKIGVRKFTGFIWLRMGTAAGSYNYGNEPLGLKKDKTFG